MTFKQLFEEMKKYKQNSFERLVVKKVIKKKLLEYFNQNKNEPNIDINQNDFINVKKINSEKQNKKPENKENEEKKITKKDENISCMIDRIQDDLNVRNILKNQYKNKVEFEKPYN